MLPARVIEGTGQWSLLRQSLIRTGAGRHELSGLSGPDESWIIVQYIQIVRAPSEALLSIFDPGPRRKPTPGDGVGFAERRSITELTELPPLVVVEGTLAGPGLDLAVVVVGSVIEVQAHPACPRADLIHRVIAIGDQHIQLPLGTRNGARAIALLNPGAVGRNRGGRLHLHAPGAVEVA